mgnify:FL=1
MSNAAEMDAQEIINYIATAPKKTPVKLYVREKPGMKVAWGDAHVYGGRRGKTVFGDWDELKTILDANADSIDYYDVENDCRNSAVPMLDLKGINARIEPGAIIRDRVEIGDRAVIMMGAIINIGSVIGEGSMIDMGTVLGGRATVGKNCHIGAGTVRPPTNNRAYSADTSWKSSSEKGEEHRSALSLIHISEPTRPY